MGFLLSVGSTLPIPVGQIVTPSYAPLVGASLQGCVYIDDLPGSGSFSGVTSARGFSKYIPAAGDFPTPGNYQLGIVGASGQGEDWWSDITVGNPASVTAPTAYTLDFLSTDGQWELFEENGSYFLQSSNGATWYSSTLTGSYTPSAGGATGTITVSSANTPTGTSIPTSGGGGVTYNLSGVVTLGAVLPLPIQLQQFMNIEVGIPVATSMVGKTLSFAVTSALNRSLLLWTLPNDDISVSSDGLTVTVSGPSTYTQSAPPNGWYWYLINETDKLRVGEGPLTLDPGPNA